ncbi:MAG: transcription termination factor Rho [Acidimicrobiales bacterium]
MDSTALERSALERKDRDELLTIAKALGGKPPARAKKADIVDLVLQLTGVDAAPGEPVPAEAESAPAPKPRAGRARKAAAPVDEPASSADEPASSAEEPAAEWEASASPTTEPEASDDGSGQAGTRPDRGGQNGQQGRQERGGRQRNQGSQGSDSGGQGQQSGQGQSRNQGQQGGQGQSRNQDRNQDRKQDQGDQSGQGDEDEGGNRRRRRRGRNRDRVEGVAPQSGSGGAAQPEEYTGEPIDVDGYLDLPDEGYGFLRIAGYLPSRDDVYVSVKQARQFGLRKGDHLTGASRPALRNEKNPALLRIDLVNGAEPDKARDRRHFEDLTPLFPDSRLTLENPADPTNMTARIVDLIAPIGKGQRGLIVSPPKAGKTTIMKQIARSIEVNNPEVHLFVLLVDERPEEVTDMKRWLKSESSTVVASTFDRPTEEHIHVAELTIERAKRLVEDGKDVVIILDGITRLSRAYNLAAPTTGRVMSGGIDTGALYPPKKFFGAARNIEEGGSLTILATALVETGSRMDEVIFEEFKGTGNMELRLDRRLAERRIYPAIDVDASSTRHEELLFLGTQLQQVWKLRRVLSGMEGGSGAGLELLTDRMKTFKTNKDFLAEIGKGAG